MARFNHVMETKETIGQEELGAIRKRHKSEKIVFTTGSFDLVHAGHILFLEDCKKQGDILVVGVGADSEVKRKGGNRPIYNEVIRLKMISSLKPVNYAFLSNRLPEEKFVDPLDRFFAALKPDVYVVNSDGGDIEERKRLTDKHNIEFVLLERWAPKEFDNISTTDTIDRIRNFYLKR